MGRLARNAQDYTTSSQLITMDQDLATQATIISGSLNQTTVCPRLTSSSGTANISRRRTP